MPEASPIPESKKKSRPPKGVSIVWDNLVIEQVVRPTGKGHAREVHPWQKRIIESYLLEPVGGRPQSYLITKSPKLSIPRIIKDLRRLAKKYQPSLVLFTQTEGSKVWVWTRLASDCEPRARGGRRRLEVSDNGRVMPSGATVNGPEIDLGPVPVVGEPPVPEPGPQG